MKRFGNMQVACGLFLTLLIASLLMSSPVWGDGGASNSGPCGKPPPPKPAHASGAEGIPPLPLPAQPLRRTEKKNPPRPPVIAVKIKTGKLLDWDTDPNDLKNLLVWMKAKLGVNFTCEEKTLEQIKLDAENSPVLYRTGHNPFAFSPDQRQRLRRYLMGGGMMIFDACCGRKPFAQAARSEIKAIFPDYPLKQIPLDHPIYNCYHQNAGLVRFGPHSLQNDRSLRSPGPARIEGVEIACRMVVVLSPHDLSCGWDMHTHTAPGATYIESKNALEIGANLIAYATATRDISVSLAQAKAYVDAEKTKTDKFRVGQLVHEGDWNPDPVGLQNLLDTVGQTTAMKISFATEPVRPIKEQLSKYPFIYMTGHADFKWDAAEVAAIRQYLSNGGFLLADACCGRQKFDLAFRREIAKVFTSPTGKAGGLKVLPAKHPLYSVYHKIGKVALTQAVHARALAGWTGEPKLEGAFVKGRPAVVYSPLALNVGWRVRPVPYAAGYAPKDALRIGVNAVIYAMSQ